MVCIDDSRNLWACGPLKAFGTVLVAGMERRLSLIRHVSLNRMINRYQCRQLGDCITTGLVESWSKVAMWWGPETLPTLEYLYLDFTQCKVAEQDILKVSSWY